MFIRKKQNKKDTSLDFKSENYKMKDSYNSDDLVVANLEYVSNSGMSFSPMVEQTTQKYIFEEIEENGKKRFQEVFTGFIADDKESIYFNLPYVVNIISLKELVPSVSKELPKYSLLLLLNEVNIIEKSKVKIKQK